MAKCNTPWKIAYKSKKNAKVAAYNTIVFDYKRNRNRRANAYLCDCGNWHVSKWHPNTARLHKKNEDTESVAEYWAKRLGIQID